MPPISLFARIKAGKVKVCFNGRRVSPPEYRFWASVDKNGPIHPVFGQCWVWTSSKSYFGYGRIMISGHHELAHRLSWVIHYKFIPKGLWVLHRCDNPSCVNPSHLFLGTQQDNMSDMASKGRGSPGHPENNVRGEDVNTAKLTKEDVWDILNTYVRGSRKYGTPALARTYGVTQGTIAHIVLGKTWRHIYIVWLQTKGERT